MVRIGGQPFLVGEVRNERKVGVALLDAEIAAEAVGLDAGDLGGQSMQGRLDLGNVLGGGLRLPAEKGDVAQHWRFRAYPIACGSTARDRSAEAVDPRTMDVIAARSATAPATRKPSWYEASVATVAPPCSARWAGIRRAMTAAAVAVPRAMPRLRLVASSPAAVPIRAREAAPMTALLFGEVKRPVPIPLSSSGGMSCP